MSTGGWHLQNRAEARVGRPCAWNQDQRGVDAGFRYTRDHPRPDERSMTGQPVGAAELEMHAGTGRCVFPVGECSDVCRGVPVDRPFELGLRLSNAFGSLPYEAAFSL